MHIPQLDDKNTFLHVDGLTNSHERRFLKKSIIHEFGPFIFFLKKKSEFGFN